MKALRLYAGIVTAILTFIVFLYLMWMHTQMDLLKIIVIYSLFLYGPSFMIPFFIGGRE